MLPIFPMTSTSLQKLLPELHGYLSQGYEIMQPISSNPSGILRGTAKLTQNTVRKSVP